jgi:hypothetical protein
LQRQRFTPKGNSGGFKDRKIYPSPNRRSDIWKRGGRKKLRACNSGVNPLFPKAGLPDKPYKGIPVISTDIFLQKEGLLFWRGAAWLYIREQ